MPSSSLVEVELGVWVRLGLALGDEVEVGRCRLESRLDYVKIHFWSGVSVGEDELKNKTNLKPKFLIYQVFLL